MSPQEILKQYITNNDFEGVELTSFDVDVMLDQWLGLNPMPVITDVNNFSDAVNKAMWNFYMADARAVFFGKAFPISIENIRWNVEQAIINRANGSPLSAALEFAENKIDQAESELYGEWQ